MRYLWIMLWLCAGLALAQDAAPNIKPDLSYADRQAWHTFLDWPQAYEDAFLQTHLGISATDPGSLTFYPLEPSWYLVEIQTYLGAYQPGYIYMAYNESWQEGFLLSFPSVTVEGNTYTLSSSIEVAALPSFNEQTKELELFSRSRGLGGCGTLARYHFSYEFAYLVRYQAQSCEIADTQGEAMLLDPHDWPVIWPQP